jgi:hypothetical protein
MNPRLTMKIYPRPDTYYQNKSSLNFDMMRSKIYLERKDSKQGAYLWLAHVICGVIMAFLTYLLMMAEDSLTKFRAGTVQNLLDKN